MTTPIRQKGEDIEINPFTITGSDGNLVDIDALDELYVFIYENNRKTNSVKYSKAGTGGYIALTRISATEYSFFILEDVSATMATGNVYMRYKPLFPKGTLPDASLDRISKKELLFELDDTPQDIIDA